MKAGEDGETHVHVRRPTNPPVAVSKPSQSVRPGSFTWICSSSSSMSQ